MNANGIDPDGAPDAPEPARSGGRGRVVGVGLSVLLAAAFVTLLIVGLTREPASLDIDHRVADGERVMAPDFTLPVFANGGSLGAVGTPITLSKMRGRPVLVNFWADWCLPCHEEAPILERLYRRFGTRVTFLTINTQDDPASARDFIRRHDATFPVLRTPSDKVRLSFGTKQMPETYVIAADGSFGMKRFAGQLTVESEAEIADYLTRTLAS